MSGVPKINIAQAQIDIDLDFDLEDFDLVDDGDTHPRILKPKTAKSAVWDMTHYKYAQDMAAQIDLSRGARTTVIVPGNFIFGDLLESLILDRGVDVTEMYMSTLSLSEDNVDSLKNIMLARPGLSRLNVLLSAYFYSHYKFDLVPYLYEELDVDDRLQVCFTNTHMKIALIGSAKGARYVLTGSANMRSSQSLEQFDFEENDELYAFYRAAFDALLDTYATIDYKQPKLAKGAQSWQAVAENPRAGKGKAP